jgi:hypothetical protein
MPLVDPINLEARKLPGFFDNDIWVQSWPYTAQTAKNKAVMTTPGAVVFRVFIYSTTPILAFFNQNDLIHRQNTA